MNKHAFPADVAEHRLFVKRTKGTDLNFSRKLDTPTFIFPTALGSLSESGAVADQFLHRKTNIYIAK